MEGRGGCELLSGVRIFDYKELKEELKNEKKEIKPMIADFCGFLKERGYAKVKLKEKDGMVIKNSFRYLKREKSFTDKLRTNPTYFNCPYKEETEIGHTNNLKLCKEFFAVRITHKNDKAEIYKEKDEFINTELESNLVTVFLLLEKISTQILTVIASGLQVSSDAMLSSLLDSYVPPKEPYSSSFLHAFRYYPSDSTASDILKKTPYRESLQCTEHTDSGLVTVIPCTYIPGLEVLDWRSLSWIPTEKNINEKEENVDEKKR